MFVGTSIYTINNILLYGILYSGMQLVALSDWLERKGNFSRIPFE